MRLPGAGGAPEIAASAGEVIVIMRQNGAGVRRALRLPHLGRLRRRPRRSRAPRPAGPRPAARHHRPRRAPARPGDLRARPDRPAPRRHRRAGPSPPRVGRCRRRRARGHRAADGGGAGHARGAAGGMKPFIYERARPAGSSSAVGAVGPGGDELARGLERAAGLPDRRRAGEGARRRAGGQLGARLVVEPVATRSCSTCRWSSPSGPGPRSPRPAPTSLVCLGGGSSTGLAKAIALSHGLPILAVPTTYAGSEMTPIYGLTGGRHKQTGKASAVLPKVVIYDPALTARPARRSHRPERLQRARPLRRGALRDRLQPGDVAHGARGRPGASPRPARGDGSPDDLDARARTLLYGA